MATEFHFPYRLLLIIFRLDAGGHGVFQLTEKQRVAIGFCFGFCFGCFVCATFRCLFGGHFQGECKC
jgi:hypothetical protein